MAFWDSAAKIGLAPVTGGASFLIPTGGGGGGGGNPYEGMPIAPGLEGVYDEYHGWVKPQFRLNAEGDVTRRSNLGGLNERLSGINLNTEGLQAIRKRALGTGPSDWAKLMLEREGAERAGALDEATSAASAGTGRAFSDLATRGGLSQGARERIATKGALGAAMARQNVNRQGILNRLGIMTGDEDRRLGLLQGLPGMEVQALEPELRKTSMWERLATHEADQDANLGLANRAYRTDVEKYNKSLAAGAIASKNQAAQRAYEQQLQQWAADRTAKAQEEEDGGVSWICTEVDKVKPFTRAEWNALLRLRVWASKHDQVRHDTYFNTLTKTLLPDLKAEGFDFSRLRKPLLEVIEYVRRQYMRSASNAYWSIVLSIAPRANVA